MTNAIPNRHYTLHAQIRSGMQHTIIIRRRRAEIIAPAIPMWLVQVLTCPFVEDTPAFVHAVVDLLPDHDVFDVVVEKLFSGKPDIVSDVEFKTDDADLIIYLTLLSSP